MKVVIAFLFILSLFSCRNARVVTMPFRNYGLSPERLMPLQYSDSKQSVRIWVSRSSSIDRVLTITQYSDSSTSAYAIEIGQKYKRKKYIDYYSRLVIQPTSSITSFFQRLDSLNLFKYSDQSEFEIVLHQPLELYIVEYHKDKKYTSIKFPKGILGYKVIEQFINGEFGSNAVQDDSAQH